MISSANDPVCSHNLFAKYYIGGKGLTPLTPKISLEILLTVCQIILIMLV